MKLSKIQVFVTYLGQKVVLTERINDTPISYPVGSVGTFLQIEHREGRQPVAIVQFDNDPLQDWVECSIDDLIPLEFVQGELIDVAMERTPEIIS